MLQLRPLEGHTFDRGQYKRLAEIEETQEWSSLLLTGQLATPPTLQQLLPETHVSVIDRVIQHESNENNDDPVLSLPATAVEATPSQQPSVRPLSPIQEPPKQVDSLKSIWERAAAAKNEASARKIYSWDASDQQQTPFLNELPAYYFDTILENHLKDGWLVQKDLFFHSIIQAILGIPSMCFKWNEKTRRLQPRWTAMRISGISSMAMESVVESLLLFGTRLIRLERITRICRSNPGLFGSIGVSFACCLAEWVVHIQHLLYQEFGQEQQDMTLMRLYQHISHLDATMTKLANLIYLDDISDQNKGTLSADIVSSIQVYGFYIPHGSNLLAMLCNQVQQHDTVVSGTDTLYKDLCLALLFHSSTPYMDTLNCWLGLQMDSDGDDDDNDDDDSKWARNTSACLNDPYGEFFVRSSTSLPGRFKLRKEKIPQWVVDSSLAEAIFRTGNALQLLKRYQPEHPLCKAKQFKLALQWSITEKDANAYMHRLQSFAALVRQYNRGDIYEVSFDADSEDKADVDMMEATEGEGQQSNDEIQPPRLQPLDNINLASDFIHTLEALIKHRRDQNRLINSSGVGTAAAFASDHYIPTIDIIRYHSIQEPLQIWCPLVNESVMHLFFNHFHIKDHLGILYNFFLLGDEVFRSGLTKALLSTDNIDGHIIVGGIRLKEHRWPPKASDLNMALRVTVLESMTLLPESTRSRLCAAWDGDMDIDDLITFGVYESKQENSWSNVLGIGALDFLYLVYRAPHPLDLIITRPILEKLNRLFSFLLQILRINAAAKSIYGSQQCPTSLLSKARFRIGQFVAAFSNYVFGTAIEATWNTFLKRMDGDPDDDSFLKSMDPVMFSEYLEHICDRMLFQCFLKQNQRPIKATLNRVLEDILAFVVALETGRPHADCLQAFNKFTKHEQQFAQVLSKLHDRGVGRLGNVMNSLHDTGSSGKFGDIHERTDAKYGHGAFVQDLLTRLDVNNYFAST